MKTLHTNYCNSKQGYLFMVPSLSKKIALCLLERFFLEISPALTILS